VDKGYCEQCNAVRPVEGGGTGMGFASRFWWVTFKCGHTFIDGDQPES
jgi:hypothetical protein